MSKYDIAVSIRPPMMPNFLKVEMRGGEPLQIPVVALSDKEAAAVWDAWKSAWLEHVANRRAAVSASMITDGTGIVPDRCKHGVWAADHCYQCAASTVTGEQK